MGLMRDAFKAVKRNRGAAGVDKVSIQMYRANLMENLHALMRELKEGSFEPLPLRRVFIPKNKDQTEFRPLGIPVVKDRIAQEVLRRLLDPVLDRSSIPLPSALSKAAIATWLLAMPCSCTPRVSSRPGCGYQGLLR